MPTFGVPLGCLPELDGLVSKLLSQKSLKTTSKVKVTLQTRSPYWSLIEFTLERAGARRFSGGEALLVCNWRVIKMIILNDEKIHKMIRPRMNFASSALQGALLRWAGVRWPIETKAVWGERKPVKVRDGRLRCMMVEAMLVMSDDCYRITWSETSLIDENSLSDFRCRSGRYPLDSIQPIRNPISF